MSEHEDDGVHFDALLREQRLQFAAIKRAADMVAGDLHKVNSAKVGARLEHVQSIWAKCVSLDVELSAYNRNEMMAPDKYY